MLSLIREYSLDVWDWIVGKRYPRQEHLQSLKGGWANQPRRVGAQLPEPDRLFPANPIIGANLKAETRLIKRSNIVDLKAKTRLAKLVRQPSLIGIWHETHPQSSVCITQLKPQPRILPAYQSEHEEF